MAKMQEKLDVNCVKIETHMLQNIPPSCVNRGDTGSPKDCTFGTYQRARISSQCIKRAIRKFCRDHGLLKEENMSQRTRRIFGEVVSRLRSITQKPAEETTKVVLAALGRIGIKTEKKNDTYQTSVLLFLSNKWIHDFTAFCAKFFDILVSSPDEKNDSSELKEALKNLVVAFKTPTQAVDIALFGRMLADKDIKGAGVEAATQMAHAISTHKVVPDFDPFTAVDDISGPDEDTGAGHMDTTLFNSACYYRYSCVDYGLLATNLNNDKELATNGMSAFMEAQVKAMPSGKITAFANHTVPEFVMVVVRDHGQPLNLVNAFRNPIVVGKKQGEEDVLINSINKLVQHQQKMQTYLSDQPMVLYAGTVEVNVPENWVKCNSINELVSKVSSLLKE
jgi:CRISPR system Cascade subunit CasC